MPRPGFTDGSGRMACLLRLPFQKGLDRVFGCPFTVEDERLDACCGQVLSCPPAHAVAQDCLAVSKDLDDTSVTVRLVLFMLTVWLVVLIGLVVLMVIVRVVVMLAFVAFPACVGRARVVADLPAGDLAVGRFEDDEAGASSEVRRHGNTVDGRVPACHAGRGHRACGR